MTKEQIKQVATDYIEDLLSDNIDYGSVNHEEDNSEAGRVHALDEFGADIFQAGARWRIDSVWHNVSEEPERERQLLILDTRGKCSVHKFYITKWSNMVKVYEIKRWAYISDLLP